ncbi:conserved hypothetical protein [Gammaproteobacteria bacterium]
MGGTVLNLDELFGQQQPLVVELNGKEFNLRRQDTFSPEEYYHMQKMRTKLSKDTATGADTEEGAHAIEVAMDEIVKMLCPELAAEKLTFIKKVKILDWYAAQMEPAEDSTEDSKNSTGA